MSVKDGHICNFCFSKHRCLQRRIRVSDITVANPLTRMVNIEIQHIALLERRLT